MMVEYIEIGIVNNTHGVRGELKVIPLTDDMKRYEKLKEVFVEDSTGKRTLYSIKNVKFFKKLVILAFQGIDDIDKAQKLKGSKIVIHRKDAVELPEDTYFICDLIGCEVYEDNNLLGKVKDVFPTGSNDVYVVKDDEGREILIPAIGHVVLNVDIINSRIDVKLPKGLID